MFSRICLRNKFCCKFSKIILCRYAYVCIYWKICSNLDICPLTWGKDYACTEGWWRRDVFSPFIGHSGCYIRWWLDAGACGCHDHFSGATSCVKAFQYTWISRALSDLSPQKTLNLRMSCPMLTTFSFPQSRVSNAETVSMWRHFHAYILHHFTHEVVKHTQAPFRHIMLTFWSLDHKSPR